MSEEPTDLPIAERCPQCRARVRPGQDWCTLCNATLSSSAIPSSDADSADADSADADSADADSADGDTVPGALPSGTVDVGVDAPAEPSAPGAAVGLEGPALADPVQSRPLVALHALHALVATAPPESGERAAATDREPGRAIEPRAPRIGVAAVAMAGRARATPDSGEIDVLLERLSASESGITGPLSALTPASGPGGKVALACGAGLVLTGLLLGGLALLGSLM